MNTVRYTKFLSVTSEGVEVEFVCRNSQGKTKRPRVFLDTHDLGLLIRAARDVRARQRSTADAMLSRAKLLTDEGLAP